MSLLGKRGKTILPAFVNDFFDVEKLLPGTFDTSGKKIDLKEIQTIFPVANIIENDKDFTIELAAPGFECKDFIIEVDNGLLSIIAKADETFVEKEKNYKRKEFSHNSFTRSFILPTDSLPDQIDASYSNGILNLLIPKKKLAFHAGKSA